MQTNPCGAAVCVALALALPTFAQPASGAKPAACFYNQDVSNFVAGDDQTVNIRVGVSRYYRLKLFAPCVGIGFVQSITLVSNPGSLICADQPNPADLFVPTGIGRQRCAVTAMTPLSAAEVAALPKNQKP